MITKHTPEGYFRDQAKSRGIDVFNLNFNEYESLLAAFEAEESRELVATLEGCRRKALVIFEVAGALAPLECNETFWLRSLLNNSNVIGLVVVLLVTNEGKVRLFQNSEGAFYRDCLHLG